MGSSVAARFVTFVAVVSIASLVAIVLLVAAVDQFEQRTTIGQASEPTLRLAQEIGMLVAAADASSRAYALTAEPAVLPPYRDARARLPADARRLVGASRLPGSPRLAATIERDVVEYFRDYGEPLVALVRSDPAAARRQLGGREGERRVAALQSQLTAYGELVREVVRERADRAAASARRADAVTAGSLLLGLFVVALTIRFATRGISRPLARVRDAAHRVGAGDLTVRITPEGGAELRELAESFNQMASRLQSDAVLIGQKRQQLALARDDAALRAQVADEMARAGTAAERADVLLARARALLGAPLGTLYADCDGDGEFTLLAHHGFDAAVAPRVLGREHRRAGRALRERRPLIVDFAAGEHEVGTADGSAVPIRHEVHFPLATGDHLVGVLSLGCPDARTIPDEEVARIAAVAEHCALVLAQAVESHRREREAILSRAVLDAISDAVLVVGGEGEDETLLLNPAMERWWQEIIGREPGGVPRPVAEVFADVAERVVDPTRLLAWFAELEADPFYRGSAGFDLEGGRSATAYVAPVVDRDGRRIGRIFVSRETTAARQAERAKDELMATVSHELRTPLSAILGFTELLRARDYPPEERAEYLDTVHEQAERLAALVNDFLDLRRLQAPGAVVAPETVDLADLVRQQVKLFAAQSALHRIVVDAPPRLELQGDAAGLQRAVANLLSNAIKYSPAGGEIRVALAAGVGQVRLSVSDPGIGIPESFQDRVFDRFFRVDSSATRRIGGTGLGLALVREIAEAHGGSAGFESREGQGSRFWIQLPAAAPGGALSPACEGHASSRRTVDGGGVRYCV